LLKNFSSLTLKGRAMKGFAMHTYQFEHVLLFGAFMMAIGAILGFRFGRRR